MWSQIPITTMQNILSVTTICSFFPLHVLFVGIVQHMHQCTKIKQTESEACLEMHLVNYDNRLLTSPYLVAYLGEDDAPRCSIPLDKSVY